MVWKENISYTRNCHWVPCWKAGPVAPISQSPSSSFRSEVCAFPTPSSCTSRLGLILEHWCHCTVYSWMCPLDKPMINHIYRSIDVNKDHTFPISKQISQHFTFLHGVCCSRSSRLGMGGGFGTRSPLSLATSLLNCCCFFQNVVSGIEISVKMKPYATAKT